MWKIPTNNDLAKFVYDYEGKILHQKRYQATIGDYNRSTHTQLLLDGTYRNGIDKNHGKTLCFTKAIDGFVIEFHVYCWEFIKICFNWYSRTSFILCIFVHYTII